MVNSAEFFEGCPSPRSVYIAFEAFPRPKGASSHIGTMVSALSKWYPPVLLLCCGAAEMPSYQREGDIYIFRHKIFNPNFLQRTIDFGAFIFQALASLKNSPEIGIFRDPWGGLAALQAQPKTPFIFEVNGLPSWELSYTFPGFSQNAALRTKITDLEHFCLDNVQGILTVSPVTQKALMKLGVKKESNALIPNCADDHFFFQSNENLQIPELSKGRWFGYIGSNHSWQGLSCLLKAWALVERDLPDVRMLIVTGGSPKVWKPLKKTVAKLGLASRILFHDSVINEKLVSIILKLSFTCAPLEETSRNVVQGCCPPKIVESMAAGVPVLASDLQVVRSLISNDKDGKLVRPGDPRAWAQGIRTLFSNDRHVKLLGENARRKALNEFSKKKFENSFGQFLKNILPQRIK